MDDLERAPQTVSLRSNLVVLSGAGISAESGIRTFRDQNGLWENHRIEDVATPRGFLRNPKLVHDFYNARRKQLLQPAVQPNAAHLALAELEKMWRGDFMLVTQNVDNLHERAGSERLIHMHGELLKARCENCKEVTHIDGDISLETECRSCGEAGHVRPHIVWFEEMPLELDRIYAALQKCSLFLAIGTSGAVYPAAGFVDLLPVKAFKIEFNLNHSEISHCFDQNIFGKASETLPSWLAKLVARIE